MLELATTLNKTGTKEQRLGHAIKQLRLSLNLPADWMAHKLGYADKSTYCKIERGEIKDLSIWKIIDLCRLFDCNIVHLFLLADVDVLETKIKTWSEFNASLSKNDEESIKLFLELLNKLPSSGKQNIVH